MPAFVYEALNGEGKNQRGTIAADSEQDANAKLKTLGLFATMINEKKGQLDQQGPVSTPVSTSEPIPAAQPPPSKTPVATAPVQESPQVPSNEGTPEANGNEQKELMAVEIASLPGITHIPISQERTLCGEDIEETAVGIPFSECSLNCPRCEKIYRYCRSIEVKTSSRTADTSDGVRSVVKGVRSALLKGMNVVDLVALLASLQESYAQFSKASEGTTTC